MRIAIANDLRMAVAALSAAVRWGGHRVAWVALDGAQAVTACRHDPPDLLLMDLLMPGMNGVEATRRIMAESPCAILIVTASVGGNSRLVFEAMGHGAIDAVDTPVLDGDGGVGRDAFLAKLDTVARLLARAQPERPGPSPAPGTPAARPGVPPLLAIGASTGGPGAVRTILGTFPADLPTPVAVIQHIDERFVAGLASWLDAETPLHVEVAQPGTRPSAGFVYLAASAENLVIDAQQVFRYTREPQGPYYPSIDVFFLSLASNWPSPAAAALLTGMGSDGARGLEGLARAGWHTIAQDQQSSLIYSMPASAVALGAVREQLPLDQIGPALVRIAAQPRYERTMRHG